MNTVGFDVRMIRSTGIGTYIRGVLGGMKNLQPLTLYGKSTENPGSPVKEFSSSIYSITEQIQYQKHLKECRLWHSPHYNIPYLKGKTKLVVTVHDLIHWIYRKEFFTPIQELYAKTMFTRVAHTADKIITVSQHTRKDLIEQFGADPEKISVIYEGVDPQFKVIPISVSAPLLNRFKIKSPYFLYVGSIKPHKNVEMLVRVFKMLKKKNSTQSSLVIAGKTDDDRLLKNEPNIHHVSDASLEDLIALYNQTTALIHPSFYEGFGLTLLEAMACGAPVLSSHAASLPEVGGEAAVFFNPQNDSELAEQMVRIEKDEIWRKSVKEKGFENIKRFSWEEAGRQTAEVYRRVLNP
jgi:glycosyltransferase involved in cell wall biosynthesis